MALDNLELEWLHSLVESCKNSYTEDEKLYIAWRASNGRIEMGPCHSAYGINKFRPENTYSVSPFPGAWTVIRESAIIRVSHGDTVRRSFEKRQQVTVCSSNGVRRLDWMTGEEIIRACDKGMMIIHGDHVEDGES